jgi:methionyl-tRNA formyltransferase
MDRRPSCVLLLSDHPIVADAAKRAAVWFDLALVVSRSRWDNAVPEELIEACQARRVEYLISLLSPIVIPKDVLDRIGEMAVNIHPAPPEWPGVGAASLALFDGAKQFGVTAHIMAERVDSGPILAVRRFAIEEADTCETLSAKAIVAANRLFDELLPTLARGEATKSCERWTKPAMTRRQFERWMTLTANDPVDVVRRKVRALRHSKLPGPFLDFHGFRFELPRFRDQDENE